MAKQGIHIPVFLAEAEMNLSEILIQLLNIPKKLWWWFPLRILTKLLLVSQKHAWWIAGIQIEVWSERLSGFYGYLAGKMHRLLAQRPVVSGGPSRPLCEILTGVVLRLLINRCSDVRCELFTCQLHNLSIYPQGSHYGDRRNGTYDWRWKLKIET